MIKFFNRKEKEKEEKEIELSEQELEKVNNFGSEEYKKELESEKKNSTELTEEQLDKMTYDYYHGDDQAFKK